MVRHTVVACQGLACRGLACRGLTCPSHLVDLAVVEQAAYHVLRLALALPLANFNKQ